LSGLHYAVAAPPYAPRGNASPAVSPRQRAPELSPQRPIHDPPPATPANAASWVLADTVFARFFRRGLDVLPAALTWLVVLSPVWAGWFLPTPLAIAVVLFDVYWLYLSISTALRARAGYQRMADESATDWHKRYRAARVFNQTYLDWDAVRHIVIIPCYKEEEALLARTLQSIAAQEIAGQIVVVLAMEAREAGAEAKARALIARFGSTVASMHYTLHPAGLPGEVAGKSANEAWAARWVHAELVGSELDLYATTITSCDADTVFHPKYFAALSYRFATDPQRYRRFWQSPILLINNIWESPSPLRVASALAGIHILSNLTRRNGMYFPQSTYSLSLKMAEDAGFWDPDVIPEDWHMYLKCFFAFQGEVEMSPIFLPTGNDAVLSATYSKSLKMEYVQHKRHAWGSSDVRYSIVQAIAHPEIPLRRKARRIVALSGNHLVWATHWFILSLGWIMPDLIVHLLGHGHCPIWLPLTSRILLWACLVPYVSMFLLDRRLRPAKPSGWRRWQTAADIAWWVLLPISSLLFSTLPALDSQTRLALGKRLEYRVTEKKAS
jgi:hypothetical protein